jgi:hypothetical protein
MTRQARSLGAERDVVAFTGMLLGCYELAAFMGGSRTYGGVGRRCQSAHTACGRDFITPLVHE